MGKYVGATGLQYLWGKISAVFAKKVDMPKYVICTLSEYEGMASHDSGTDYIVVDENTSLLKIMKGDTQKWPVPYEKQYLTFKALEMGTFSFSKGPIYYSINGGEWTALTAATNTPTLAPGDTIRWKGTVAFAWLSGIGTFSSTGKFNAYGNPLSCRYGDNFKTVTSISGKTSLLQRLFKGCTGLIHAGNLKLISLNAPEYGYAEMFSGCSSLITAPDLPATAVVTRCYENMFRGCTALLTPPNLPATSMTTQCYMSMFRGCTSLKTAPTLNAKTLAQSCYQEMFYGCTSLVTAPALPATGTMPQGCYTDMFNGCSNLETAPELLGSTLSKSSYARMFDACPKINYIKCLATSISADSCLYYWLRGVSATGTFVKHPDNTSWPRSANGIPSNWTVEDAVIE